MSDLSLVQKILYGVLVILGISFWFGLGFPFANHNESFVIVTQLEKMDLGDVLTNRVYPVANYRPLGQAVAWLGYTLGGRSGASVQLFNYVVAALAWLVLFFALRERRVMGFAALLSGGVLFSGYIYLFHLHGVFYSPLLLLVAMLFMLETKTITAGRLWVVTLTALVAAFFHPYALPVFLAALVGFVLERPREFGAFRRMLGGTIVGALALIVVLVIVPRHESLMTTREMLEGIVTSYRMVEVNSIVSAAVTLLVVLTVWSFPITSTNRWIALGAALACVVVAYILGVPIMFVWIGVSLVKAILLKKWWLGIVIAGTALLPGPAATGSPTYAIFVIMACTGALALSWRGAEEKISPWGDWIAGLTMVSAVCLLILLRSGVQVPVLSRVAQPIIAEREKTFQMEEIVNWLVHSEYARYEPVLIRRSDNPRGASDAVDRTHRPPTDQEYLSKYTGSRRQGDAQPGKTLLVGFGGDEVPGETALFTVESSQAGPARVFLPPPK